MTPEAAPERPPERIDRIATRLAEAAADRPVLVDEAGRSLSGAELEAAVGAAAAALRGLGVRGGDRVVLVSENGVAAAVLALALSRLDSWTVLVNARLTASELDAIRAHARPRLTVHTVGISDAAAAHAGRDGGRPLELRGMDAVTATPAEPAEPEPVAARGREQVAALIYTSGTTGRPKGVMLTHANLAFVAAVSGRLRRLGPADVAYGVLPITHVFGLASVFLGTLSYGGLLRLVPRFDAEAAARSLAEDGVTVFQGVPAMYARLLELAGRRGGSLPAPRLRYLSAGGGPLDLALKRRVEALWGIPLHNGYGLTETAPTVTTTRIEDPAPDDSAGPPIPGVEVRITGPGTDRDLPAGEIGEIRVRGPNVMRGYYRDPERTAAVLPPDGWFRTGDLGRLDGRGNLYVVGRLKELIIRSGFNVYPPEV
ncbi:MAG TPA: long-chain fatty acid--CoA ligase, partial [Geminicoccaceae bacterium]|nr:long-chain fatty acid--CoA ligase [Geminicoccaceae bacterium]